jgi:hypothetical protein
MHIISFFTRYSGDAFCRAGGAWPAQEHLHGLGLDVDEDDDQRHRRASATIFIRHRRR